MRLRTFSSSSGFEGPGRPACECRCADTAATLRRRNPAPARALMDCTGSRTMLRLTYLLVVAVSCVRSAPLPVQSSLVDQQEGALSDRLALMEESLDLGEEGNVREKRAVRTSGRWTNATIPFQFDTNSLTLVQRNRIMKAMKVWQKKTCVRFVERTDEDFFLDIFRNDASCYAPVGMSRITPFLVSGQPLQLSLTYCLSAAHRGKIVHELGHVIGLYHEHQRPDRDSYIMILRENIINSDVIREQYAKLDYADSLGVPYDYHSIMHYGPTDNSANGKPTFIINPNSSFEGTIREKTRPSMSDYRRVNLLYNCSMKGKNKKEYPDMLPDSANDVKSGDRLSLSPEIEGANTTWWLNCTDGCRISDAAGKKFKADDVSNCTELIFELQKVGGVMDSVYIKVGDTVIVQQRPTNQTVETISCMLNGTRCAYKPRCTNDHECSSDTFVVGAVGKSEGDQIRHKDQLILNVSLPKSDVMMTSWMHCNEESVGGGLCYKVNCGVSDNTFGGTLPPSTPSSVCSEPFSFLVTKL